MGAASGPYLSIESLRGLRYIERIANECCGRESSRCGQDSIYMRIPCTGSITRDRVTPTRLLRYLRFYTTESYGDRSLPSLFTLVPGNDDEEGNLPRIEEDPF